MTGRVGAADEDGRRRETLNVTALAALLAAAASTAGIVYQIWPDHHFRATLTVLPSMVSNVSYGSYAKGLASSRTPDDQMGLVLLLRAQVEGVDRGKLRLHSGVYTASNKPILLRSQSLSEVFRHGAPISEQIGRAWVPYPNSSGQFYVHLELYSGDALVAYANSRPFSTRQTRTGL